MHIYILVHVSCDVYILYTVQLNISLFREINNFILLIFKGKIDFFLISEH